MLSALRRQHALVALTTDLPANPGATAPTRPFLDYLIGILKH